MQDNINVDVLLGMPIDLSLAIGLSWPCRAQNATQKSVSSSKQNKKHEAKQEEPSAKTNPTYEIICDTILFVNDIIRVKLE